MHQHVDSLKRHGYFFTVCVYTTSIMSSIHGFDKLPFSVQVNKILKNMFWVLPKHWLTVSRGLSKICDDDFPRFAGFWQPSKN